jgi:hypothetical protein
MHYVHSGGKALHRRALHTWLPAIAIAGALSLTSLGCKPGTPPEGDPAPAVKCQLPQPSAPDGNPNPYAALGNSDWSFLGPHDWGSRVISLAMNPMNPHELWAGSASGGLWVNQDTRTKNGWRWVNTNPHQVLAVGAIAIHPSDSNNIYIGTGEVYNYNNTNEGMDLHHNRGVYGTGILHSTDGGATWSKALGLPDLNTLGVQDIEIVKGAAGTEVWAATTEGVYQSVNGSEFKQKLNHKMTTDVSVDPTNTLNIVAAVGNLGSPLSKSGLYTSADGGSNWTFTFTRSQTAFPGKFEIARSAQNPSKLYAMGGTWNPEYFYNNQYSTIAANGSNSSPGQCIWPDTAGNNGAVSVTWLYGSTDNGLHWELISNANGVTGGQGHYTVAITANPKNDQHLFFGGIAPINASYNGGDTVKGLSIAGANGFSDGCLSAAMGDFDVHQILISPSDTNLVYVCSDQGVYMSTDGLKTIRRINENLAIMQFYPTLGYHPTNPNILFGCAQDYGPGCMSYMGNGGTTGRPSWQLLYGYGHEAGCAAYDTLNDVAYVGIHMGSMMSRTRILHPENVIDPPDTGWANGAFWFMPDNSPFANGNLCETHASWNAPTVLSQVPPQRLYTGKDMVYVSFINDSVSKAAGRIWNPTNSTGAGLNGNPILRMAVHPQNPDTLFIATAARNGIMDVYMSKDGGVSWNKITAPSMPKGRNPSCIALDPTGAGTVYLTFEGYGAGHVWKGTLSGTTCNWTIIDNGLPDAFTRAVAIDPWKQGRVFVATDHGVYESNNGGADWNYISSGMPAGLLGVQLIVYKSPRILRLVTHGNGVWQRNI